jgi:copper chaperone CopZ
VDGMHCSACAALIEESLGEADGVVTASVDLDSARAVVGYVPTVIGIDALRSIIADAGYAATPVD